MKAIETTTSLPMADAEDAVRNGLAANGFGILTEIDIAATFKAKLGIERSPLKILGACNPSLANEALELEPSTALALPCNVALTPSADGGTHVSIADPRDLMDDPRFGEVAEAAARRLEAALASLDDSQR